VKVRTLPLQRFKKPSLKNGGFFVFINTDCSFYKPIEGSLSA